MKGFLTLGLVAVCWLGPGARLSSAQGAYFPPPAWNQKLPASTRFVLTMFEEVCANNFCAQIAQAVLDRETGLVWERSPKSSALTLHDAQSACIITVHADRGGWRLPHVDELASLYDFSITSGLALPPGHPFQNIDGFYWTGTPDPDINGNFVVSFTDSLFNVPFNSRLRDNPGPAWCVRGTR